MELSRAGEGQNRDRDTPSSLMSLCAPGESSASPTCKVSSACCQDFNSSGMGIPEGSPCRRQSLALVLFLVMKAAKHLQHHPGSSLCLCCWGRRIFVLLGQEDSCAAGAGGFLCQGCAGSSPGWIPSSPHREAAWRGFSDFGFLISAALRHLRNSFHSQEAELPH